MQPSTPSRPSPTPHRLRAIGLLAISAAGCHHPGIVKPPTAVASDPLFEAAIAPAIRDAAVSHDHDEPLNADAQVGSLILLDAAWRPQRNGLGVVLRRWKRVDALAKDGAACWLVHFSVWQEFDGQNYLEPYRASRVTAELGGFNVARHPIDCADFH